MITMLVIVAGMVGIAAKGLSNFVGNFTGMTFLKNESFPKYLFKAPQIQDNLNIVMNASARIHYINYAAASVGIPHMLQMAIAMMETIFVDVIVCKLISLFWKGQFKCIFFSPLTFEFKRVQGTVETVVRIQQN